MLVDMNLHHQNNQILIQVLWARLVPQEQLLTLYHLDIIEAKSVTINRMQNSLQEWDKQLNNIIKKKGKNGKQ